MSVYTIKTLTLTLETKSVECQLTRCALVDNPTTEDLTTFCGTETSSTPRYQLELGGYQDWDNTGTAGSLFDVIHDAYTADPIAELDFVLTVGTATRTGVCKPFQDVPFGGDAGGALTADITLDVVGIPT